MDLAEMLSVIWRSKWIILAAALVAASVVAYDSFSKDAVYRADTVLIVSSLAPTNVFSNEDMLAASYAELALTDTVQSKAREMAGVAGNSSGISAESTDQSPFVRVSATNTDPARALGDANSVAQALVAYIDELQLKSLEDKRESMLDQLAQIDAEKKQIQAVEPVDQARIDALDSVRESIIRQYEELSAGLSQSSLVIVDEARSAAAVPSHPLRNTSIAFVLGALAGAIIGFSVDSVRKALRWEG